MKASELIKELKVQVEKHGDLEVAYDCGVIDVNYVSEYFAASSPDPDGKWNGRDAPFFDLTDA